MAERALAAVVVVLCVLALAVTASTLSASGDLERGPGEGSGPGSSDRPQGQQTPTNESTSEPLGLDGRWVELLIAGFLLLALPSLVFLGRERLLGAALAIGFFVGLVGLFWYLSNGGGDAPVQAAAENVSAGLQGGGEMGSADESTAEQTRSSPPLFSLGIVAVALAMAVALVYYASSSVDASVDPQPTEESTADQPTGVAEAAGRAADRIDDHEGDVSNAIYAAWREMTEAVDGPDPRTGTPGEFADAAVAAGMGRDRVDDLTDLFERVRYGDEPVTQAHEQRATETLRAIEAEHEALDAGTTDDSLDAARTDESFHAETADDGLDAETTDDAHPRGEQS